MEIDHDRCYDVIRSRDRRFDGRFFVGVHTTGIYCRPICPSRTPKSTNVDFYPHRAAAEAAGFRPCRRCRPEAAPGSDEWHGTASVVSRALRLIDEGVLDGPVGATPAGPVEALAGRLGVSERHLRRLFAEHVGASPDAVARSRRAHLARELLHTTDLRVADVAFAAGFGSVRQCNDVVRSVFHATPTELRAAPSPRRARAPRGATGRGAPLVLRLAARPPFDGAAVLHHCRARRLPHLEVVDATTYSRVVAVRGPDGQRALGTVSATPSDDHVVVAVDLPPEVGLGAVVGGVRRLFDLDADPDAVGDALGADPLVGPVLRRAPGLRVPGCWSGFEAVVRAVVGQQVSVAAASTVVDRIVAAHGPALDPTVPDPTVPDPDVPDPDVPDPDVPELSRAFPDPEDVADAPLESRGLIGRRADTIRHLAHLNLTGELPLDGSVAVDALAERLLAVPGIGPWTASYVALRMGEPDAFPAGDLHVQRVLGVTTERAAAARAEPWRPWRAYGALALWQLPMPGPA